MGGGSRRPYVSMKIGSIRHPCRVALRLVADRAGSLETYYSPGPGIAGLPHHGPMLVISPSSILPRSARAVRRVTSEVLRKTIRANLQRSLGGSGASASRARPWPRPQSGEWAGRSGGAGAFAPLRSQGRHVRRCLGLFTRSSALFRDDKCAHIFFAHYSIEAGGQ